MASFGKIAREYILGNGKGFDNLPNMIKEMVRLYNCDLRGLNEFSSLQRAYLKVYQASFSQQDIADGLNWLYLHDISSVVVLENSTYTLQLLEGILNCNTMNLGFICSIADTYVKEFNTPYQKVVLHGLDIKIKKSAIRTMHSLPNNVL